MNKFKNIKSPKVLEEIDVYNFLDRVQNPENEILEKILEARKLHTTNKKEYDLIKAKLPCYTLSFNFHSTKKDINIKSATGFIYIDLDNSIEIDFTNQYIFATWLSLSATGRGILVKVEGLTKQNFATTYKEVSKLLNIHSDDGAKKASQYCVNSYDKDLHINNESITYKCKDKTIKNSPSTEIFKKENRVRTVMGGNKILRFNNFSDYDFKGKDYIIFWEDKEFKSEVYIPKRINKGEREAILSVIAHQIRALNKNISENELYHFISYINKNRCIPSLPAKEVEKIIRYKMSLEDIQPILNCERRVIFNPDCKLNPREKRTIVNQVLGKIKSCNTVKNIEEYINNWDYESHGKITQEKLAKQTGFNIKTIEKYYGQFKGLIKELNTKTYCTAYS